MSAVRLLAMSGSGATILATGSRADVGAWRAWADRQDLAGCNLIVEAADGSREPLAAPLADSAPGGHGGRTPRLWTQVEGREMVEFEAGGVGDARRATEAIAAKYQAPVFVWKGYQVGSAECVFRREPRVMGIGVAP